MKIFGFYISKINWKTKYAEAELSRQYTEDNYRKALNELWFLKRNHWFNQTLWFDSDHYACACRGLFEVVKLYLKGFNCDREKLLSHIEDILEQTNLARWTHEEMNKNLKLFTGWDRKRMDKIEKILHE